MRALQWLENKKIIKLIIKKKKFVHLDKNGIYYRKHGLPEKHFLRALSNDFKGMNVITKKSKLTREEMNACLGLLKKKIAIEVCKEEGMLKIKITSQGKKLLGEDSLEEKFLQNDFPLDFADIKDVNKFAFDELKRRKGFLKLEEKKEITVKLTELGQEVVQLDLAGDYINRLTPTMLKTGSWKEKDFRAYDVEINVPKISGGRRHPYNEALNVIRSTFLEMGFQEMEGPWAQCGLLRIIR